MATAQNEDVTHRITGGTIFAQANAENVVDAIVALGLHYQEWKIKKTGVNTFTCHVSREGDIMTMLEAKYHCRGKRYADDPVYPTISVHPKLFRFL
jgi:hypothetical protein